MLMDESFSENLRKASSVDEFLDIINKTEAAVDAEDDKPQRQLQQEHAGFWR